MEHDKALERRLAAAASMLALVAASLLLAGVLEPSRGLAAPSPVDPVWQVGVRSQPAVEPSQTISFTVMVPLVGHVEPPPIQAWRAAYYASGNLNGDPVYLDEQPVLDYDWGQGSPSGLPADHFSILWEGMWHLEMGEYTFFAFADDGMRLWLDGELLIDAWTPGLGFHQATTVVGTDGLHHLKVAYFEETGAAAFHLRWRRTDLYPQWHGDYYNQPWVEYGWQYAQDESVIQYDWELGCPAGLPCDGFSVAWNADRLFEPGTHYIYLYADEGYQLYIDGNKVGEGGWLDGQSGGAEDAAFVLEAGGVEYHHITYNFHDRGTFAEARLWIEYVEHPKWTAEYFTNMNLSGTPELLRNEERVFYDWGLEKPRPKMPSPDNFSVRWSGPRYFHSGCYRFGLFADDGARLKVNGEWLIDAWLSGRGEYHSRLVCLDSGYHEVVIEYFDNTGEAEIRFWWE